MRTQEIYTDYQDHFEYFGNTEIERIRMQGEKSSNMTGSCLTPSMRLWNFSTIVLQSINLEGIAWDDEVTYISTVVELRRILPLILIGSQFNFRSIPKG
jgi:hypothetical protein